MSDDAALRDLARRAGIAVEWTNAAREPRVVNAEVLRRILATLGFPNATSGEIRESRERLKGSDELRLAAPLVTAVTGAPITLIHGSGGAPATAALTLESGARRDIKPVYSGRRVTLDGIAEAGYHTLHIGDRAVTLAVAPKKAFTTEDVAEGAPLWGVAVQLYGLRHPGDGGIGNTAGLSVLTTGAAKYGADIIALSPTHALFGADLGRYGPYSPSSRLFLNPLHADPRLLFGVTRVSAAIGELALARQWGTFEAADLIDWPTTAAAKLAVFRRLFDDLWEACERGDPGPLGREFAKFRADGGDLLEQHARFEVLHAAQLAAEPPRWNWRTWPQTWQDRTSADVQAFAAANSRDIAFHAFLQWIADRSLAAAQADARRAGMRIGLVADLAIGMDAGGSHAWSRPDDLVVGLNVGAPPDLFNPAGQDWGLTAFSPRALLASGFAPFLATLRVAMRNAGGVRIDHALGLSRLWLVPDGASPAEGAYLAYPLDDLLRLIMLESVRHGAIVIGEDLGTVPEGFHAALTDAGISGMRVLWFERDEDGFRSPDAWPSGAVAMTSTHDLPTVAGWWRGADIEARARLGRLAPNGGVTAQQRDRAQDRELLWNAFRAADAAEGRTMPKDPAPAVDAAVRFVAATPAQLALVPLEDMLGLEEQPNLPGTTDEHPNWKRRYREPADSIFELPQVRRRADILKKRGA